MLSVGRSISKNTGQGCRFRSANGVGRLTTVTDESGESSFSYDDAGRLSEYSVTPRGYSVPYVFHKAYDDLGCITGITYPDNEGQGGTVNYDYRAGNLASVTEGSTTYAPFSNYTALGQARHIVYGNGTTTDFTYYQTTSRLQEIATITPHDGTVLDLGYDVYDGNGNVVIISDRLHGQDHGFQYDGMNRMKTAFGPYGRIDYTYDGAGNILSKICSGGNRTDQQVAYSPNKASGYDNRASTIDGTDFTYDYQGERATKSSGPLTTLHIGSLYTVTNGAGTKHIFAGGSRIASKGAIGFYFYHTDHLGSVRVASRASDAAAVQAVSYYPFGEIFSNQGINGGSPLVDLPYKFTGQEYDPEIRLYYFGARYYDPGLGRFITPDTIVQSPGDPQSLNRYAYCRNNPLLYTDPTGHIFGIDDLIIGIIIGAALGAATSAISGGDIGLGALTGAITGGFLAGAGGIVEAFKLTGVVAAGAYAAAGASAGAINAGISGSDIGIGALSGGAFAAAAYAFPGPNFKPFGQSPVGTIGNRLFNSSLTGAAFGAVSAGMTGGDMLYGAGMGAAAWAGGEAAGMLVGHGLGMAMSDSHCYEFRNGAFYYYAQGEIPFTPGGGVIIGDKLQLQGFNTINGMADFSHTVDAHERAHFAQQTVLSPSYLPLHLLSQGIGGLVGMGTGVGFWDGTHRYNIFERWWIDHCCPVKNQ